MSDEKKTRAKPVPVKLLLEGALGASGVPGIKNCIETRIGLAEARKGLREMLNATEDAGLKADLVALYGALYPDAGDPTVKGAMGVTKDVISVGKNSVVQFSAAALGVGRGGAVRKQIVDAGDGKQGYLITAA